MGVVDGVSVSSTSGGTPEGVRLRGGSGSSFRGEDELGDP